MPLNCGAGKDSRVPWTAGSSNQSILKEINTEYSLEGLMLKLQYFGHLMKRANSLEKTKMLRKTEDRRRRGRQRMQIGWHHQLSGHEFEQSPRGGEGQGSLSCCHPKGCRVKAWLNEWARTTRGCVQDQQYLSCVPYRASLVAHLVKNLPAVQETQVRFLGWQDPLEKEMANHSNILAWKTPWTEEAGGRQPMGSQSWAQRDDWHTLYGLQCSAQAEKAADSLPDTAS